jgi:hypothetical protein
MSSDVGECEYNFAQLGSLDMLMIFGLAGWPSMVTLPLTSAVPGSADASGKHSRIVNTAKNVRFGCI